MFLIPASGDEPLTFAAKNLPAGLTLDAKRGLITGSLKAAGTTPVEITVTNAKGKATGRITIVGGERRARADAAARMELVERLGQHGDGRAGEGVGRRHGEERPPPAGLHVHQHRRRVGRRLRARPETPRPGGRRDANGEPTTNEHFPDMKGLVDHIHSLGLKAGLYSSPGPTTCQGLGASWQHEEQDARAYARWGFDYLKYDWCGYSQIAPTPTLEDRKKPYKLMGDILKKQDRDIVFSICQYGAGNVWEWGREVGGHLWRMTGDIRDDWPSMTGIGFQQTGREQYAGPRRLERHGHARRRHGGLEPGIAAVEPHAERAAHPHDAVGASGGAAAHRRGPREDRRVDDEHARQPRDARRESGRTRPRRRPQMERRLDGGLGASALGRHDGGRPLQPRARGSRGDGDVRRISGSAAALPVRDMWLQKDLGRASGKFSAVVPRHGAVLVKMGQPKR